MTNNGLAILVGRLWAKGTIVVVHANGVCLLSHRTLPDRRWWPH